MAFVCNIPENGEIIINGLEKKWDEYIGRVEIGFDDQNGNVYSVFLQLHRANRYGDDTYEFSFWVVCASIDAKDEFINDGLQTRNFLEGEDRKKTLQAVCSALQGMVGEAQPALVFFVTVVPYLPAEALQKYWSICKALTDVGYIGGEVDPFCGTHMWQLERIN